MFGLTSLLESIHSLEFEHLYALTRWQHASAHLSSCLSLFGRRSSKADEARIIAKLTSHDLEIIERQLRELLDKFEVKTGTKLDVIG